MSSLKLHYIIPPVRGGAENNSNIVYLPTKIGRSWERVFNNLKPAESKYFISFVSIPGVYLNARRLNIFRRLAVQCEYEDQIRDNNIKISEHELEREMKLANFNEDPPIRRETINFNPHHIKPSSRGKRVDTFENIAYLMVDFHSDLHTIFGNLRIPEIQINIDQINQVDETGPYEMNQSMIRFLRKQAIQRGEEMQRKKPPMRFRAKP